MLIATSPCASFIVWIGVHELAWFDPNAAIASLELYGTDIDLLSPYDASSDVATVSMSAWLPFA